MKKNIVKILIAVGVISAGIFAVYTQINNIPTHNTWEGFIGATLFYGPVLTGTWIASERMKERRLTLSIVLKGFVIFACIGFVSSFIAFLVTL